VTTFRTWLETLADAGALVPAATVLARLSDDGDVEVATPATTSDHLSELTVETVASALHRSPSTIRGLLGAGAFPNAFKLNGKNWLIPRADLTAYIDAQRPRPPSDLPAPQRRKTEPDLSSWRRHYRGAS
jgi:hypothetical protein